MSRAARTAGLVVAVGVLGGVAAPAAAERGERPLQRKAPPLTTPWTAQVSRTAPLPEYPRPQLARRAWRSLNGQWQFAIARPGERPPFGRTLRETVLVPYPVQSALSGIARNEKEMWYRRTFAVPRAWRGKRVRLNFGAVTHAATVYVNGRRIGAHRGSYDAFSFDVTGALRRRGRNELVVRVSDPQAYGGGQAVGKQAPVSVSVLFTAASGIWQTVWLEPVGRAHVTRLDQTPDLARDRLVVVPHVDRPSGTRVVLRARVGRRVVGRASGRPGRRIALPVPRPRLWTPDRPFLYDLDVELRRGGRVVDRVRSYFGMRSIAVRRVGGVPRIVLNGRVHFQTGPLDQGYWPDGVYTAPTDAALRWDLEETKRLGFTMTRKHVKVEPQRWYFHADRLGLLVWQDMPNMSVYRVPSRADERQFERELAEMVDELRSHPSIVAWVPFNEAWGAFDVARVGRSVERRDPSRLLNVHSGGANCCLAEEPPTGDLRDSHLYNGPFAPEPDHRASTIGEFGCCIVRTPGHEWDPERPTNLGDGAGPFAGTSSSKAAREGLLERSWDALVQQVRTPGLSAAVFTELTDVEREQAGLVTYDRRVRKFAPALVRRLNERLVRAAAGAPAPQPGAVPPGTTARWTFDEGAGEVARDSGGRGGELRLRGGAGFAPGVRGSALRVGGGEQAAVAPGPVVDTTRSFTVSAWLRTADRTQSAAAVGQQGTPAPGFAVGPLAGDQRPDLAPAFATLGVPRPALPDWRWTLALPGTAGCTALDCAIRAGTGYGDSRQNPREDRWHHVVVIVDRERQTSAIALDGVLVDHRIVETVTDARGPFVVGGGPLLGGAGFAGLVDEVRVFDRALNAADVWRLHAAERPAAGLRGGR